MESEKSRIEKYLELQVKEYRGRSEQYFVPEKSYAFKTELMNQGKIMNEILPPKKVFKPSQINKIAASIFGAGGSLTLSGFLVIQNGIWGPPLILFILASVLLIKIWYLDANNTIILDKKGLTYNEDFYLWKDILSSHILYTKRQSKNAEDESYLILELTNGKIKKLELTKINFSNFLTDDSSKDEVIFGHYIEMYKKQLV